MYNNFNFNMLWRKLYYNFFFLTGGRINVLMLLGIKFLNTTNLKFDICK